MFIIKRYVIVHPSLSGERFDQHCYTQADMSDMIHVLRLPVYTLRADYISMVLFSI